MSDLKSVALRAIKLMDLTSLNDDDTEHSVAQLCRNAKTAFGNTAAVCIYPRFIPVARKTLIEQDTPDIKVATVANFPHGDDDAGSAVTETRAAVDAGADEVDAVFPYRAFLSGNKRAGFELVRSCKAACGGLPLKVIIETGELRERSFIVDAARVCIEAGADFIKTSTGKVPVNATPASARIVLETIRDLGVQKAVGFKAAGGIRTTEDAAKYLAIADEIFGPDWADKSHFRLGASSLLESVLRFLRKAGGVDKPSDR